MLRGTIRNDDFQRKAALQHCCDIISNGCSIVPTLLRCVQFKIPSGKITFTRRVGTKNRRRHEIKTHDSCRVIYICRISQTTISITIVNTMLLTL